MLTQNCERAKSDRSYVTWVNNLEEHNLEDGALTLERLKDELLGDANDHAAATTTTMPPPSATLFPDAPSLPPGSTSQPPPASVRGGHAGPSLGHCSSCSTSVATRDENPAPFVHEHRQQQKKLDKIYFSCLFLFTVLSSFYTVEIRELESLTLLYLLWHIL